MLWPLIAVLFVVLAGCASDDAPSLRPPPTEPTSTPTPEVTPTPTPTAEGAPRLVVISNPAGATVEVGVKDVNDVFTEGTGRIVRATPLDIELSDADVNFRSDWTNLQFVITLDGYVPAIQTISLSESGLEAGKTYTVEVTLNRP